jgi:hypothetical protein
MTVYDQVNTALNGSKNFQEKNASASGSPDPVCEGHTVLAGQLNGLASLFAQTADAVSKGFPAKTAMADLAKRNQVDPEFIEKTAEYLEDLGALILKSAVQQVFDEKVRQKTAQSGHTPTSSDRVASAVRRFQALAHS